MHIDSQTTHRNGKTYTRHLLRTSYRDGKKVCKKTIANLSHCSEAEIDAIKLALKHRNDLAQLGTIGGGIKLVQGLAIGAIFLLYTIAQRLGIVTALGTNRQGMLALWQVFARVIGQGSRLSAARLARAHAVGAILDLSRLDEDDLYENLDWVHDQQRRIEIALHDMRKTEGKSNIYFYDVTSSYFEGVDNDLAEFGYNRDGKSGKKQIVIGLLCDHDGRPLSIEVFSGNTSDLKTFSSQINKAAEDFGAKEVTFVGDRGMIKSGQISDLGENNFHYITAITKAQIDSLLNSGVLQMSLFDETVAEVKADDGVRYILRRNPHRAAEIAESRNNKLYTINTLAQELSNYLAEHPRASSEVVLRRMQGKAERLKIAKWVTISVNNRVVQVVVNEEALAEQSKLDGCYAIKTDLTEEVASAKEVHDRYKDLGLVESAFRDCKTNHLEIRPIYVRKEKRTRSHVFIVMLAYMIIQELREKWRYIDITVEEGIDLLASLCITEVITKDGKAATLIPQPRPEIKRLLDAAEVELPPVLPLERKTVVSTKNGLDEARI